MGSDGDSCGCCVLAALGCFIAGCVIVPIRLSHLGEIRGLEPANDFRNISTYCVVLEVWNRPTDRREPCGAHDQFGSCSRSQGFTAISMQDACIDDYVFFFAFNTSGASQVGPTALDRSQITYMQDNCTRAFGCTSSDCACDRQGGWWKMAELDGATRTAVRDWSTAVSQGQSVRRGAGICSSSEFPAVRLAASEAHNSADFWAGQSVPCWVALAYSRDDAAFNKHYDCVSYNLNYNLNCTKLNSPHDNWNSDNGQDTAHLLLISGSILICVGVGFMAILCWSFCITKESPNVRRMPRAAPRSVRAARYTHNPASRIPQLHGRRAVAVVQGTLCTRSTGQAAAATTVVGAELNRR